MHIMLLAPEILDTHTRRFLQMLLDGGYVVTCVAKDNPMPEGRERFSYIKYPNIYISKRIIIQRLRRVLTEWGIALCLRHIWQQVNPDIVHVLYINLQAYHCALAGLCPLVLTALGSDINSFFEMGIKDTEREKKITKALLAADHITADTHEILERCDILADHSLNSTLFYFGIDLNLFKPRSEDEKNLLRQKLGIPLKSKVLLSPRRLIPQMNHDLILKAFLEFKNVSCLDAVLIFRRFGYLSPSFEIALRELAKDFGIGDQVIWVDEMDYANIPILYSLADLVINIPEQDGLPVTLFEVSACMTPVITSDLPCYKEFISEGVYFRIGLGDINGIVHAMQRVFSKSGWDMVEDLRKNYDLVAEKASQEKCFSVIEEIYQGLV